MGVIRNEQNIAMSGRSYFDRSHKIEPDRHIWPIFEIGNFCHAARICLRRMRRSVPEPVDNSLPGGLEGISERTTIWGRWPSFVKSRYPDTMWGYLISDIFLANGDALKRIASQPHKGIYQIASPTRTGRSWDRSMTSPRAESDPFIP